MDVETSTPWSASVNSILRVDSKQILHDALLEESLAGGVDLRFLPTGELERP